MCPSPFDRPARRLAGGLLLVSLTGMPVLADETPSPGVIFGPGVDWSLTGRVSASTAADLNRDLLPDESSDLLYTTRLDAGLLLGAKTKRGFYTVDLGLVGAVYLGPNQPETDQPVDPRFSASALYTGKRYEFSSKFAFDIQPTSETQFDDTGILSERALQLTISYSAGLALEISRRDSLSISVSANAIDFLDGDPGLVANRNVTAGLDWSHKLDARTSLGLDLTFGHFTSDDVLATRSQTIGVGMNFSQQRTRRHTIGLRAGLTTVRTEESGRSDEINVGFDGSASFGYALRDVAFNFFLSQNIEPSSVGQLQSFSRAGGQLSWAITPRESLAFSVNYTHRTGLDESGSYNSASARASYDLALSREARLSLGYQLRAQDDDVTGFATGHQVFLTLSHDFTLLP